MDPALFKSKVYLVTGGAAGIGLACVEHLLKAGAHVYAVDIHPEPTKEFVALQNGRLTYFHAEVRDRARSHEVLTTILSKHNHLDGLVNNAAVTLLEGELAGDDMYDEIMEINVRGVWNYGTEALAQMQKQGSGSIVNIASISALAGKARLALYSASKHAVLGLTRTWAIDFAKYGVRVNCVAPGATDTAMARSPLKTVMGPVYGMNKTEDELLQLVVNNIPMKKIGMPDDMANAVDFFLSDLSSYVTGQIVCVAGGMDL